MVAAFAFAALAGCFGLMMDEVARGGDWPGWDEGWALVAFPLGTPVAIAAALVVGGRAVPATSARLVALVTGAVWVSGAAVFAVWFVLGRW
jgi:hypothetical protein